VNIDVFTLFPAWFEWFVEQRHVRNAVEGGLRFDTVDLRATTPLGAGKVDDTPYGGGAGMVIRVDVVEAALRERYVSDAEEVRRSRRVIALAAGGRPFDDALAGELAAMVVADAVIRKLPGALGHAESALEESFSPALEGAPEYPHYTRPLEWRGHRVPDVLLSGNHAEIDAWRRARSRERSGS